MRDKYDTEKRFGRSHNPPLSTAGVIWRFLLVPVSILIAIGTIEWLFF